MAGHQKRETETAQRSKRKLRQRVTLLAGVAELFTRREH
jgi:hypothetical protein